MCAVGNSFHTSTNVGIGGANVPLKLLVEVEQRTHSTLVESVQGLR